MKWVSSGEVVVQVGWVFVVGLVLEVGLGVGGWDGVSMVLSAWGRVDVRNAMLRGKQVTGYRRKGSRC